MKVCPKCGTTYESRVEFCFQDGSPLDAPAPAAAPEPPVAPEPAPEPAVEPVPVPQPVVQADAPAPSAIEDVPDPSFAPSADPTDLPMPRGLADVFDVPEPRFAPLRRAFEGPSEGNTKPIQAVPPDDADPFKPLPQEPEATAPLSVEDEVLSAPKPLGPLPTEPEETAPVPDPDGTLTGPKPIEAPRSRPGLVRPPRPAHERAVPGSLEADADTLVPAPGDSAPAAVQEPEPPAEDFSAFAAMPDAPADDPEEEDDDAAVLPPPAEPASAGPNIGILVGIAAAALALVAMGGWWFSQPSAPEPAPVVHVAPAPEPTPPPPPPPPPPEPEPEPEVVPAVVEPEPEPPPEPPPAAPTEAPKPKPAPPKPPAEPAPPPANDGTADANPWGAQPSQAATEGVLSISTQPPGATVFLDDKKVGKAPLDRRIAHGSHTVRVEMPGYTSDARAIQLASDSMAVSFELRAELARGRVALFGVANSTVSIDGAQGGVVPFQVTLSEGTHVFQVTLPSGESFSTSRDIRFGTDGRTLTVNLASP